MGRSIRRGVCMLVAVGLTLTAPACSCGAPTPRLDAGMDGSVTTRPDSGVRVGAELRYRNVAGSTTSQSENYRLVRTHGRGTTGTSENATLRDAVNGGGQP